MLALPVAVLAATVAPDAAGAAHGAKARQAAAATTGTPGAGSTTAPAATGRTHLHQRRTADVTTTPAVSTTPTPPATGTVPGAVSGQPPSEQTGSVSGGTVAPTSTGHTDVHTRANLTTGSTGRTGRLRLTAAAVTGTPVVIGTSTDAGALVQQEPAGTTFEIAGGVHAGDFSVEPKAGDVFEADPGAVLDGGYGCASCTQLRDAFHAGLRWSDENGVVISGPSGGLLVIRNYDQNCGTGCADPEQHAVIDPACNCGHQSGSAANWTVDRVQVTGSYSRGITASGGIVIESSTIDHNGRLGIGGGNGDQGSTTIENDTIVDNDTRNVCTDPGECGGIKLTDTAGATITNDAISANNGPGVWFDGRSGTAADPDVVEHDTINDNTGAAVRVEVSGYVTVADDVMQGDGADGVAVLACISCHNLTANDNTITDVLAKSGVLVYQDSRAAQFPVANVDVAGNVIEGVGTALVRNGVGQCSAAACDGSVFKSNVSFTENTYGCGSFLWGDLAGSGLQTSAALLSWSQWQAKGFDSTGTDSC